MGKLILVRHGESEANRLRCFATSGGVPLTETGRAQARSLAIHIAQQFRPELVISSEFVRARQTGDILADHLGLEVETLGGIHERNFGCLRGLPYERLRELAAQDPAYDPAREWMWAPEGGESRDGVRVRVMEALDRLTARCPHSELVVVSHGVVMVSVWAHLTGTWAGANVPANCGMVVVEHAAGRFGLPVKVDACEPAQAAQPASEASS